MQLKYRSILSSYPLVSDQVDKTELAVILAEFEKILVGGIDGDVVELGCYKGTTSLFLKRLLDTYESDKQLHVYDSFQGLPPKVRQDQSVAGDQFRGGELSVGKKDLLMEFKRSRLQPPIVHKGWFSDLSGSDLPDTVAFAYLDGDFYQSIMDSLKLVWPRMQPGGVLCIDDYGREALPGVERAVHDYFGRIPDGLRLSHSIAIIRR